VQRANVQLDLLRWNVRADGPFLEPDLDLGPYPERITDALNDWATRAPHRTLLAERSPQGEWIRVSYAQFRRRALGVAQWLREQSGISSERPIAILSGNSIPHAILAVGAMYAGIPYAPVAPAYALQSRDYRKLHQVIELLTPGLIFAHGNTDAFGRALPDHAILTELPDRESDEVPPQPGPDAIAKILFTSGSTGVPKGVITTHRMLASNQEMLRSLFPFFRDNDGADLILCDWLPWNHTFGGSHNFGIAIYNGGALYIDNGKPVAGPLFEETVRNIREIAPAACFNVPKGFEMLAARMREDSELRERFFSRLRMMFYAGAGLSQHVWDELDRLAVETTGSHVPMVTGLGATETAPMAICATPPHNAGAGFIGLPVPGVKLKLWPVNGKLEVRVKGPNVTPGFWRNPEATALAFDEDGYYCMGDAARFVDPADPNLGLIFDGRIAEDFKLATGTWVSVGPLKTALILHFAPYVRDAVIAGHDRDDVTALLFPDPEHYSKLADPQTVFQELLSSFARHSTGSSNRVARALVLQDPPSLDAGEITDKGSLNSAAVLRRRGLDVDRLYEDPPGSGILAIKPA
jgi:feruloyl-CoA synthase